MRADGRVAIYQLRCFCFPLPPHFVRHLPLCGRQEGWAKAHTSTKRAALTRGPSILIILNLFLTKIYSCRMLAMRAATLTATGITTNAATGFMCLDDLLRCQIHTPDNNQTNNPGCHTKHLFYFASTLITVSLSYFLAGRKSRYRNAIRKTTATAVPKLNASPPTNTLPNW